MSRVRARALALAGVLLALGAFPSGAGAHGLVAPIASSYLARVSRVAAGLEAKVADGDQRMWLRVVGQDGGGLGLSRCPAPALLGFRGGGQPELRDVLPEPVGGVSATGV